MNKLTLIECGRFAHEALSKGGGEVCAVFPRSIYLRLPAERYVCLGDVSLGRLRSLRSAGKSDGA
jgi:hypothetical protein